MPKYVCCKCKPEENPRLYPGTLYSLDCPAHGQTWHRLAKQYESAALEENAAARRAHGYGPAENLNSP